MSAPALTRTAAQLATSHPSQGVLILAAVTAVISFSIFMMMLKGVPWRAIVSLGGSVVTAVILVANSDKLSNVGAGTIVIVGVLLLAFAALVKRMRRSVE